MDALDIGRVCLRRWYVCLPLIILALVAGYSYANSRPSSYTVVGGFAVVPPPTTTSPGPNGTTETNDPSLLNPLTKAGGATLLQQALVQDLSTTAAQQQLLPANSDVTYLVTLPSSAGVSVVSVTATGSDEQVALATAQRVMAAAPARLKLIQTSAGAPENSMFRSVVVSPPMTTAVTPPSKIKLIGAFGIVGALVGSGLAVLVDRRSSKRKSAAPATRPSSPPSPPPLSPPAAGPSTRADGPAHAASRAADIPRSVSRLR